ncbi:sensor histidine kinase, partial [bacterium]|nr:sensor histidine kinase [bacterium]
MEKLPIPNRLDRPATALQHDSDLVELEGTIQEQWLALDGCRLKLVDQTNAFSALLSLAAGSPVPRGWLPGSRVRVTGICMVNAGSPGVSAGTIDPQSFEILLRSPADLLVLQPPPWWTPEHIIWVLGAIIGALLLAVLGFSWNHRRHMREQVLARARSEAEFAAVWNERNRIARELHDTLAQGLGAISMQLEVAKRKLPADSEARGALEEARILARSNLAESRNAIWNMRSQVLETGDLPGALRNILHSLTEGTKSKGDLFVRGRCRRLAPVTENNLLRICQEAITNAAKYASADRIEVVLEYGERQLQLSVLDDGCGFDPRHPPASDSGFGLVGMRERAAQMHGQLTVTSQLGEGTLLTLILPLP